MVTNAELKTIRPNALGDAEGRISPGQAWRRLSCVWTVWVSAILAGLGGGSGWDARAEVTAAYLVGLPTVGEGKARYPISVRYAATAGERLAFLGLDVTGSDARLTGNGANYSGFTFVANATALQGWSALPGTGFGSGSNRSSIEWETASLYLVPGTTLIGELVVELQGITPGQDERLVRLDGPDSVFGVEIPGTPGSFQFVQPGVEYVADNASPVAVADGVRLRRGETVSTLESGGLSVLANDSDPDGDGLTAVLVEGPRNGSLTLNGDGTFRYVHDGGGTYVDRFTYKVSDGRLESSSVMVRITIVQTASLDEGNAFTLDLLADEERFGVIRQWEIRWGDGYEVTMDSGPRSVSHDFLDGAISPVVTAQAKDGSGTLLFTTTTEVEVRNVTPTLELQGEATVAEGAVYRLTLGTVTDPGQDTVSEWVVDWGDGARETFTTSGEKTHVYADGLATREIVVDLKDDDGVHARAGRREVTVTNVIPTLTLRGSGGLIPAFEGGVFTLSLSSSDPGADQISGWTFDWGDGTSESVAGNPSRVTHTYLDGPETVTVTAQATDEDGTHNAAAALTFPVANVAPSIELVGDSTVSEGSEYRLVLGAVSDPGRDTVSEWVVNWGDGVREVFTSGGEKVHVYTDGPASHEIVVDLRDEDQLHLGVGRRGVSVTDVAPELKLNFEGTESLSTSVAEGSEVVVRVRSPDPGVDTIREWSMDWGDGKTETFSGVPESARHTYPDGPGVFQIFATATDEDGTHRGSQTLELTVTNVAPSIVLSGAPTVRKGEVFQLGLGAIADPGLDRVSAWIVDWGDGATERFESGGAKDHVYRDGPASLEILVNLEDEDGLHRNAGRLAVVVTDLSVPPGIRGPGNAVEGASYRLVLVAGNRSGIQEWVVDWGDGTTSTAPGSASAVEHTYPDGPSRHTITAGIRVGEGTLETVGTIDVPVINVPPRIPLSGSRVVDEGTIFSLRMGEVVDPGQDTVTEYRVHWGDGTSDTYSRAGDVSHTYADGWAERTITVDLMDEDATHLDADLAAGPEGVQILRDLSGLVLYWVGGGVLQRALEAEGPYEDVMLGFGPYRIGGSEGPEYYRHRRSFAVQVRNVIPTIALNGSGVADEGSPYVLTLGPVRDPGADVVTEYIVHWGDGTSDTYSKAGEVTHVYPDGPKGRVITVDLVDEDGTHADADVHGGIGRPRLKQNGSDWVLEWDGWAVLEQASVVEGPYELVTGATSPHRIADLTSPRFYRLLRSHAVRVLNVPPRIELSGEREVDEGAAYTLRLGKVTDPGQDRVSEYVVHWGDGATDRFTAAGEVRHAYADGPAYHTIIVDLVDDDGTHPDADVVAGEGIPKVVRRGEGWIVDWQGWGILQESATAEGPYRDVLAGFGPYPLVGPTSPRFFRVFRSLPVRVRNVVPRIALKGERRAQLGVPYTLTLDDVLEPGADTITGYIVHWGDGSSDRHERPGPVSHRFEQVPGLHVVTIDLEDEDGLHADADVLGARGPLSLRGDRSDWRLEWEGWGILQEALDIEGPFRDVETAVSPWNLNRGGSRGFQRLLRSHPVEVIR